MNIYSDRVAKLCAGITGTPDEHAIKFIESIATGWIDLATAHHINLPPDDVAKDALQALVNLLNDPEDNIEKYLGKPLAFGAYKECYPWTDLYVIKFCAQRNPTLDEQSLLTKATEHGIAHFFVPSFYTQLPRRIESALLDKEDDGLQYNPETHEWEENPDWEDNTLLTHICIQPRISPYSDTTGDERFNTSVLKWREMLRLVPQLHSDDRQEWEALNGACLKWVIDFGYYYGREGLIRLRDFCETFKIWDLHSDNTGHLLPTVSGYGAPVVLDWMSN